MRFVALSIVTILAVVCIASTSYATTVTCTVTGVTYVSHINNTSGNPVSSKQFFIGCADGTFFYANGGGNPNTTTCPVIDSDGLKNYMSFGETAKVTGRTLTINYNPNVTCSLPTGVMPTTFTTNLITYLALNGA